MPTDPRRKRIIRNIRQWRDEMQAILDDQAAWNRLHPHESPLDIDPDGRMQRMVGDATRMLDADLGTGAIAPFVFWDGSSREVH